MPPKKTPLTRSRAFQSFIRQRDHALESILFKYQVRLAQIVDVLKTRAQEIAAHMSTKNQGREHAKLSRQMFEHRLTPWFQMGIEQALSLVQQMRRSCYTLSYAGQAEAIGRALNKHTRVNLSLSDIRDEMSRKSGRDGDIHARIELAFHRLLRKVVDSFQLSQVLESPAKEVLERIDRAFPREVKIPKRAKMAKIREAARDSGEGVNLSFGVIDPKTWDEMVEDYLSEYIPFGRSPNDRVFYPVQFSDDEQLDELTGYSWELEEEVMNDFVQSVRNGENDAANENGITEMQWIAVIDGKTDDCCESRDGLSSSEIEKKLDDGDIDSDCDAITPPAHFNCRCRSAPMTDEILEEKPQADFSGFDSWLDSKEDQGT